MRLNSKLLGNLEKGKTPLLILHGLFGSLSNWRAVAQNLSDHYAVICADLRNHGGSDQAAAMDYQIMADDVIQLIDHYQLASVHLVGHSMGGKVAMCCALQSTARIKSLCVVDIAPLRYTNKFAHILTALQSLPLTTIRSRGQADQLLAEKISPLSLRQFLLQNLIQSEGAYHWRINLKAIEQQIEPLMDFPTTLLTRSYPKPSCFIRGELSDYVQDSHRSLIKKSFPQSQIKTLPACGHWLHAEQANIFCNSLREFVDAVPN